MKFTRDGIGEAGSAPPLLKGKGGDGKEPAFWGFLTTGSKSRWKRLRAGVQAVRCPPPGAASPPRRARPEPTPGTGVRSAAAQPPRRPQPSLRWGGGGALAPHRLSGPQGAGCTCWAAPLEQ